jgi:hypothetical protein
MNPCGPMLWRKHASRRRLRPFRRRERLHGVDRPLRRTMLNKCGFAAHANIEQGTARSTTGIKWAFRKPSTNIGVLGKIDKVPVIFAQGRVHSYEEGRRLLLPNKSRRRNFVNATQSRRSSRHRQKSRGRLRPITASGIGSLTRKCRLRLLSKGRLRASGNVSAQSYRSKGTLRLRVLQNKLEILSVGCGIRRSLENPRRVSQTFRVRESPTNASRELRQRLRYNLQQRIHRPHN